MRMQGLGYIDIPKNISDYAAEIDNKSLHCQANWGWVVFGEEKLTCLIKPKKLKMSKVLKTILHEKIWKVLKFRNYPLCGG